MVRITLNRRLYGLILSAVCFIVILIVLPLSVRSAGQSGYSLVEAQKVLALIEHMLEDQQQRADSELRFVDVTESEFNSYLAYLIDAGQEDVLREVRVVLLKGNRIEGKIHIDLRDKRFPRFLKPEMNFYFAGRVHVGNGRARLAVSELFLENEPVQPALLDLAILVASRIQGVEPVHLYDWYDLPYGIKDIKTDKGTVTFYY